MLLLNPRKFSEGSAITCSTCATSEGTGEKSMKDAKKDYADKSDPIRLRHTHIELDSSNHAKLKVGNQ